MTTTISETLLERIAAAPSIYRVAKDSGVDSTIIYRFVSGERSPALGAIEKLVAYFELELRPARRKKK